MTGTRYADSLAARELLGEFSRMATRSCPEVAATVPVLQGVLEQGGALETCLRLAMNTPASTSPFDTQVYAAAVHVASALWFVEIGRDATPAIDAALGHMHAALALCAPPAGVR